GNCGRLRYSLLLGPHNSSIVRYKECILLRVGGSVVVHVVLYGRARQQGMDVSLRSSETDREDRLRFHSNDCVELQAVRVWRCGRAEHQASSSGQAHREELES